MKKCWIILLCLMCVITVGCQKKEEVANSKDASGEEKVVAITPGEESFDGSGEDAILNEGAFQRIRILKKINTDEILEKYDVDDGTEKNKYPLQKKYLLSDTYENKEFGIEKMEVYFLRIYIRMPLRSTT